MQYGLIKQLIHLLIEFDPQSIIYEAVYKSDVHALIVKLLLHKTGMGNI